MVKSANFPKLASPSEGLKRFEMQNEKQNTIEKEVKTERITIRFTHSEYKKLKDKVGESNIKMANYIQKVSLRHKINCKTDLLVLNQVRKIGANINQIAKIANAEKSVSKSADLLSSELNTLKNMLQQVINSIN